MADHWTDITKWFAEDSALKWVKEDISEFDISDDILAGWEEAVRYQGFDVRVLLKKIKSSHRKYIAKEAKDDVSFIFKMGATDQEFRYSNMEHIMKDIALILYMFANRGTSWEHLKQKSRAEFPKIMGWMEEKYGIDTSKRTPGSSVGPEVVLVSRIAACFPVKVCEFFNKGHGRVLFPITEIGIVAAPHCIYCNSFTSVIPLSSPETSKLHFVSFYVHYLNDRVLHSDTGKYTKVKQMLTYYLAGYNSAAVPNTSRISFLNKL